MTWIEITAPDVKVRPLNQNYWEKVDDFSKYGKITVELHTGEVGTITRSSRSVSGKRPLGIIKVEANPGYIVSTYNGPPMAEERYKAGSSNSYIRKLNSTSTGVFDARYLDRGTNRIEISHVQFLEVVPVIETIEETRIEVIPEPDAIYERAGNVPLGEDTYSQTGRSGEVSIKENVTYRDGVETAREEISRTVISEARPAIIKIGSGVVAEKPAMFGREGEFYVRIPTLEGIRYLLDGVEVSGEVPLNDDLNIEAEARPDYTMMPGVSSWVITVPEEFEGLPVGPITVPAPERKGNRITIPFINGADYNDIYSGTILGPGAHDMTENMLIVPIMWDHDEPVNYTIENEGDTWPFEYYEPVKVEPPKEFTRYVVIPESEHVEYFDGDSGKILEPGEVQIGSKLQVNTRLLSDRSFMTDNNTSWLYTRTGGVMALPPDDWYLRTRVLILPQHSQIEYYNVETGETLVPTLEDDYGNITRYYIDVPTAEITVAARGIGSAFVTNPRDEWYFRADMMEKGLQINHHISTSKPGYKSGPTEEEFHRFIDVYWNGELITYWRTPTIMAGDYEIEIKLKDRGPYWGTPDWMRGEHGEPVSVSIGDGRAPFEWTADNTMIARGYWDPKDKWKSLTIYTREHNDRPMGSFNLRMQMVFYYLAQIPMTQRRIGNAKSIAPYNWDDFVHIYINGEKMNTDDVKSESNIDGIGSIELGTGYKEIKLKLVSKDFTWDQIGDDRLLSRTHLLIQGKLFDGGFHYFEPDINGDLVWSGVIPENTTFASIGILPFMPTVVEGIRLVAKTPQYDYETKTLIIPEDEHIFYFDVDTGEVYYPGPMQITRFTRITVRVKKNPVQIDGQWYNLTIQDDHRFWYYEVTEIGYNHQYTAPAPTQSGYIVTIPSGIDGLVYWDSLGQEFVSGEIDLRTRPYESMRLQAFTLYSTHKLNNPHEIWFMSANLEVFSKHPSRDTNVITIPVVPGVKYYNKDTGTELTGRVEIDDDITIIAKPMDDYVLKSPVNEWNFHWILVEKQWVTAEAPTMADNWITIPSIEGVRYYHSVTNATLSGRIYAHEELTIKVGSTYEGYTLNNPDDEWTFTPEETELKEIVFENRDPRINIRVGDKDINGGAVAVDTGIEQLFVLTLREDAQFTEAPYFEDTEGNKLPFRLLPDERVAILEVEFDDASPIKLITPGIAQLTTTIVFTGQNATLEVQQAGSIAHTLKPGDNAVLNRTKSYQFVIKADSGYEFDRAGKATYQNNTVNIYPDGTNIKASYDIVGVKGPVFISMSAVQLTTDTGTNTVGFNNLYVVDKETLNEVSLELLRKRRQFVFSPPEPGGLNYDSYLATDPHTYIVNTIQLPFSIDDADIANRERITLGFTQIFPSAPRLNKDKLTVNLGEIHVESKYHNAYDYKNTDIILHLPYSGPVHLDPSYVMDETISLEYLVDAYTGHTTINLRSSFVDDNVFHSKETYIGNEIPFISMKDGSTVGSTSESRSLVNNNVMTPYIEVIRNIPYEMDSDFNKDTTLTVDNLHDVTGRIYVHNISLKLNTTLTEENTIKSILAGGITIK